MIFSDFELVTMGMKFLGETAYESTDCVGSCEESLNSKTVSKKCRGIEVKTRTKGTGTGELKISAHYPYDVRTTSLGMALADLKAGVMAYGQNSVHKVFSTVMLVEDEDGNQKLKAYPNCVVKEAPSIKIENGSEEVSEVEMTISFMPDEHGNGMYEAIVSQLTDETVKTTWMTAFTPELVRVQSV
ncbi:hypothetical protein [Anaerosacchariphilus polymeriproducens]|uniref:Phage tail protein n=1 Tax=Anaerosacchariphilus polymeriproducens TaxID=1812858 RepID=A0A371ARK7_9FIRM|nr:hypothetical protein [Anaerosacchariphilus polymeriproducens]RDU22209.1 hypothetical protein DWV06_16930 [Anaerosacchariphilus polymeriproducens]